MSDATSCHRFYEVVDPAEREERGVTYPNLTDAMVNAGPRLEVWELADDAEQTRMVKVWPDPEFEPTGTTGPDAPLRTAAAKVAERWNIDALDTEVTRRFVTENIGRAEREATAILAEHEPVIAQQVHALVSLAWGRGFVAGFGAGHEAFASMLERISGAVHS